MKRKSAFFLIALLFTFSAVMADTQYPGKRVEEEGVSGMVMDEDSKPIRDVNITVILQAKKEKMTLTDINGGYSFVLLKPGTYKLVFEKEGYKKVIKEKIQVKEKASLQINVEMPGFLPASERGPSPWYFFEY